MQTKNYVLEVCAASIESAWAAHRGGATRIELCAALSEGGVTPSYGLMKLARQIPDLTVNVLIRPRGGDFLYTPDEVRMMADDIRMARDLGINGVVIGALTSDGHIDMPTMQILIEAAGPLSITFHRAFDVCNHPSEALEDIISLGCHRLLTSGQASSALAGANLLCDLVQQAGERLIIMPGGGIHSSNIQSLAKLTSASEFHASASTLIQSRMQFRRTGVSMGQPDADEYARKETDEGKVADILHALATLP